MAQKQARIVIVGAGLAGAATAYHLGLRGAREVLLLEQEEMAGVHSSGRNAAMVREAMDVEVLQALATESTRALRSGRLAEYRACGGLLLGRGEEPAAHWIPGARGRGRFAAEDGVIDVAALLGAYLRGQNVRYGCAFRGMVDAGDVIEVHTTNGVIETEILVNAAGAWAGVVGDLPLTPLNRHIYVSALDEAIDKTWPWLWDLEHDYYLRPESGGWLMSACDETPAAPGDYVYDPDNLLSLLHKLSQYQPGIPEPRIVHHWVGQRTFAPDRLPVVGFDARTERLFHVAALGGHGVTLSYAIGALAARLLQGSEAGDEALSAARLKPEPDPSSSSSAALDIAEDDRYGADDGRRLPSSSRPGPIRPSGPDAGSG